MESKNDDELITMESLYAYLAGEGGEYTQKNKIYNILVGNKSSNKRAIYVTVSFISRTRESGKQGVEL